MLFSTDWLAQYVDLPDDLQELADELTAAGLAVELIEETGDGDTVFDVDVTTNRVDAMNHLGMAREAAVVTGAELRPPGFEVEDEADEETASAVSVRIEAPELCTRYAARVVRGVTVGPSPDWLRRRLEAIGLRPINNVVDVTNFVLWETGQPLHGFDLAKVGGAEVVVRTARAGETLTTLDGEERKLTGEMLVIADRDVPVALAGVMGGLDSEVGAGTSDVLIESAWFDPLSVRATAKALGMHTDASHRFERGADPQMQAKAAARAAALIAEVGGGAALAGVVDETAAGPEGGHTARHAPPTVDLDLDRLDAFAGVAVEEGAPERWLRGLGFGVEETAARRLAVTVPSWRLGDVEEEADLFEEVLRIHGYGAIPATLPSLGEPDAPPTPRQRLRRRLRATAAACGFAEAIDWAFHSPDELDLFPPAGPPEETAGEEPVELANPLSERYTLMRRSQVPGLTTSALYNLRRDVSSVRLFELGHTFGRRKEGDPGAGIEDVTERETLALVAGGTVGTPWEGERELDLFDLKGVVEALAEAAGHGIEARPADGLPGLLPGTAAELFLRGDPGRRIGALGRLSANEDGVELYAAEIEIAPLELPEEARQAARRVAPPPRLPGIEADLTLTHLETVRWAEIEGTLEAERAPELVRFRLKDRYTGEGVPEGAVNTTIAFLYHGGERQLTQEEVNERQEALAAVLEARHGLGDQEGES